MKQKINLGAYGWHHKHWSDSFYPEDLPQADDDDWRLAYYSNEFDAVLIPADHWQAGKINDCENWLDSVHENFQFFVECNSSLLKIVSLEDFSAALKKLSPQLSGLVFLDGLQSMSGEEKKSFITLADSLQLELFDTTSGSSRFTFIEDELMDLRAAKVMLEPFIARLGESEKEAVVIINHPRLQAENLSKFRQVVEMMGH